MSKDVEISVDGSIGYITVCKEDQANALGPVTAGEIASAIRSIEQEASAIVLRSRGRVFSAGGDIAHLKELNRKGDTEVARLQIQNKFQDLIVAIKSSPCPVIAQVQGAAVGAGADLALACDIRIASDKAWLQEAWINIGLLSALGAAFTLPTSIGPGAASELLFTGRRVDADECRTLGLFQRVVSPNDLESAVNDVVRGIVSHTRASVTSMKEVMWESQRSAFEHYLNVAARAQAVLICSSEFTLKLDELSARLESKRSKEK